MLEKVHNYDDKKTMRALKWMAVMGFIAFTLWCVAMARGQEVAQTIPPVQVPVNQVVADVPLTRAEIIEKSRQLGRLDVAIPMQENVVKSAQELLKELTDQRDALAKELGLDGKD